MRPLKLVAGALLLLATSSLSASGPVGIYGIIDKVVFEPTEQNAERVQLWGAFMYVDGQNGAVTSTETNVSRAKRGYLYFKARSARPGYTTEQQVTATRNEWADLKVVAGTGQAVGFGKWGYAGAFEGIQPNTETRPYTYERAPQGGDMVELRVRASTETPADPVTYQTNVGIIKLDSNGRHAEIVKALKAAK